MPQLLHLWIFAAVTVGILALTGFLHAVGKLGRPGRAVSAALCRAPALDLVVALFTLAPPITGAILAGWLGLAASILGQILGLSLWIVAHEWAHQSALAGPRIVKVLNRIVGRPRNHAALWVTVVALPLFWHIRLAQIFVYPLLILLLNFPRYKQGEWVNCSRQKFEGLIGHDLIWCLYCDWMTGVYSLGAEMLRNVESFWCPIRFYDGKKCENCKLDFPDLENGWVPADGTMAQVESKMNQMYADGRREWFNHPARGGATPLTVNGRDLAASPPSTPAPPQDADAKP